ELVEHVLLFGAQIRRENLAELQRPLPGFARGVEDFDPFHHGLRGLVDLAPILLQLTQKLLGVLGRAGAGARAAGRRETDRGDDGDGAETGARGAGRRCKRIRLSSVSAVHDSSRGSLPAVRCFKRSGSTIRAMEGGATKEDAARPAA